MSTPFELFRRHQKVLLAAVTGTAVLSFIVSDATSNSGEMSPVGVAALVIGSLAVVGWVWGAGEGKSGEKAIFGGVLGLAITLIFMFLGRPPATISAATGNISRSDLDDLGRQRSLANSMVSRIYYANSMNQMIARFQPDRARPPLFGFGSQNQTQELLISELLNREADELGIEVTDEAAMTFLKLAAKSEFDPKDKEQLTQEVFTAAIQQTAANFPGAKEDTIIEAIRHEMRARQAAQVLLGGNRMTPADVWDLHRKLNTRQSAQFVSIPVEDFVDKDAKPSDADLTKTFDEYKSNVPGFTSKGVPEEGRPGLFLQRRVRVAYVEPNYEAIEKLAGAVTEEEIVARYEQQYKREMPLLPQVPAVTPDPAAPTTEKPADPTAPAPEKPADPPQPAEGDQPAEGAKPADPAPPATDKPADPASKPDGASLRPRASMLQPVVLIQDQPAAEAAKPAEATPAAEAPATEKPAAPAAEGETPAAPAAEEKPAADQPAGDEPTPPAGDKPAEVKPEGDKPATAPLTVPSVDSLDPDGDPAPPVGIRPLDEALRLQIHDEILAEKTKVLLEEKMSAARDFMNDLHLGVSEYLNHQKTDQKAQAELSKDAISPEDATQQLKQYAKKHQLQYNETPVLLTLEELLSSEDHPLGGARVGEQGRVVDILSRSQADVLYSASTAFDLAQKASYAFWKIEDVAAHIPASLDEPGMKEKATQVWRTLQARPLAEKRAQELVDLASKSDKPFAEALAEQTVTGSGSKKVFPISSGEFSWLDRPFVPQQSRGDSAPRLGAIQGVEGAGPSFMAKVFNDMKPGDTAVVPNEDRSVFYMTRIDKRTPGTPTEAEVMRKQFLESQGDLSQYAMQQSRALDGNFADRLFIKHGVKLSASEEKNDQ